MSWLRCPNCGESCKRNAKFCSNCGAPLGAATAVQAQALRRPILAFALSVLASLGLIAVALSMSFFDDAPGSVGSPTAGLFHAVGAVQLILALGVLVSATFLVMGGFDVKLWGGAILGLGLVSVASLLVIVFEGTFAAIFLGVPGLVAVAAGVLARRTPKAGA